jgi:hypothetical protein
LFKNVSKLPIFKNTSKITSIHNTSNNSIYKLIS